MNPSNPVEPVALPGPVDLVPAADGAAADPRWRELGVLRGETLWGQFAGAAARTPGALALVARTTAGEEVRWTFAQLHDTALRTAAGFARAGLRPGERVLLQLPNTAEFAAVVLGLFRLGALPVLALPAHRSAELRHVAAAGGAVAFVTTDRTGAASSRCDHRELARDLLRTPGCGALRLVLVAGEPEEFGDLADLAVPDAEAAEVALPAPPGPDDVAFLQLSGGTTGAPKLIPRTHDAYAFTVRESARICGLDEDSRMLVVLPVAHNYPMSSPGILGTWCAGGTVVLATDPSPGSAFALVAAEGVTHVSLVPPLALLWTAAAGDTDHDLSTLRVVGVGGAKCTPELARRVPQALGARLQQVFGMAEGLVNYTRLDDPDDVVLHTQGRPISTHDEVRVVDEDDRDVPPGEPGYLLTRGPYTIRAYHAAPAQNRTSFTADGFYRTGDVVRLRPDGNLVVEGRAADRVNRGGEKVSAEEVEDVLLTHPGVHDAALVGVPDEHLGERTCAFVVPRPGANPSVRELRAHVRSAGLAEFKVPDRVEVVDAFPPTAVGKTSRRQLRTALAALLAERGATAASPRPRES
ncbi:(2,3-dihydroxybenzoyl)adenylate synthase [Kineococcus sp. SYSU DK018]|uniref:(2,3-dihydroxybenzoyl)adenylate synthase n=1 Tax=Kineococcus sp. SYSU DK018 TaxID=3383139 RepID=UPI003D7D95B3